MPSVWLRTRPTATSGTASNTGSADEKSSTCYGGSFKTQREANARKAWIAGELAALRVP